MSSSRPSQSSNNSGGSRNTVRIIAQTTSDAKLQANFEESGGYNICDKEHKNSVFIIKGAQRFFSSLQEDQSPSIKRNEVELHQKFIS
ncbi:unnamed protein product [Lupinus luteus]|uniref:Uncharacterized protein n=1 Tax=Lupinus luteus TaxID=3873 RepID=A0AAV1YAP0_LUPLU